MKELNKFLKEIMGKRMTKKDKALLDLLRLKVKAKEITVEQAKKIWNELVLKEYKGLEQQIRELWKSRGLEVIEERFVAVGKDKFKWTIIAKRTLT